MQIACHTLNLANLTIPKPLWYSCRKKQQCGGWFGCCWHQHAGNKYVDLHRHRPMQYFYEWRRLQDMLFNCQQFKYYLFILCNILIASNSQWHITRRLVSKTQHQNKYTTDTTCDGQIFQMSPFSCVYSLLNRNDMETCVTHIDYWPPGTNTFTSLGGVEKSETKPHQKSYDTLLECWGVFSMK